MDICGCCQFRPVKCSQVSVLHPEKLNIVYVKKVISHVNVVEIILCTVRYYHDWRIHDKISH